MINRTEGMQQGTIQRATDDATQTTRTDTASRFERRTMPSSKAEEMVALLANRIKSNEARR